MNKTFLTTLVFIFSTIAFSQTNTTPAFNFGFEKTTVGENLPDNWYQLGTKDYILKIDSVERHNGKNSMLIQSTDSTKSNSLGCVAYKLPAVKKGKKIEVRAWIKMKDVNDGALGLLLRIDGQTSTLEYDDMLDKKIMGTSDWAMYSVKLDCPKGATKIFIAAMLKGNGKVWADDFEILIDGKQIKRSDLIATYKADKDIEYDKGSKIGTIELTDQKIKDLKTLGLVWGFLKYYHPNIAAGNFNWDYELFRILPLVIAAKTTVARDSILTEWIRNLGTFKLAGSARKIKKQIKLTPDTSWISTSNLSAGLRAQLEKVRKAKRTNMNYYIALTPGVGNPIFKNEKSYSSMTFPDAGFRLLTLFRYWNMIQYFYPNKHLIGENWKDVLTEFIPKFINDTSQLTYQLTTLELIARIHDTHADMWSYDKTLRTWKGVNYAPIEVTFIENKAVITAYLDDSLGKATGLQVGDVITSVNNKPVEDIIKSKLKYTPASNYPTQLRDLACDLLGTNDTLMNITFSRNGISEMKKISINPKIKVNQYRKYTLKDTCFKFINSDIAYFYAGNIKSKYLPDMMSKIKNTKGLIIDMRCYPSEFIVFTLGKYLIPNRTSFVEFSAGNIKTPGLFTIYPYRKSGRKNKDYYKGPVVILVNEITQSQAEYTTMAFRAAPNAKVIGSTTAGADGNVSEIILPGNLASMISGIGVYYPDGTETQRVGIVPDIEVKPTISGILQGKDEVLERAIEYINSGK